jgi:hypothetical protein
VTIAEVALNIANALESFASGLDESHNIVALVSNVMLGTRLTHKLRIVRTEQTVQRSLEGIGTGQRKLVNSEVKLRGDRIQNSRINNSTHCKPFRKEKTLPANRCRLSYIITSRRGMSTPIFRIFWIHLIPAVAASATDQQFTLISRQFRQSVLNQLASLPCDNAASATLEGVNFQTVRTSNTHGILQNNHFKPLSNGLGYSSIILLLSTFARLNFSNWGKFLKLLLSRAIFSYSGNFSKIKIDVSRWYQRTYGDAGGPRRP